LDSVDTLKPGNRIAKITRIDRKDVNRNLKVPELIDLVNAQYKNGSFLAYELTEMGKEVLRIIKAPIEMMISFATFYFVLPRSEEEDQLTSFFRNPVK